MNVQGDIQIYISVPSKYSTERWKPENFHSTKKWKNSLWKTSFFEQRILAFLFYFYS